MFGLLAGVASLMIAGALAYQQDEPINARRRNFKVYYTDVALQNTYRTSLLHWYTDRKNPLCPYVYPEDPDFRIDWWAKYKAQEMIIQKGLKPYDYLGVFDADKYNVWEQYGNYVFFRKQQEAKLSLPKDFYGK